MLTLLLTSYIGERFQKQIHVKKKKKKKKKKKTIRAEWEHYIKEFVYLSKGKYSGAAFVMSVKSKHQMTVK